MPYTGASSSFGKYFILKLLDAIGNPPIAIALWSGAEAAPPQISPLGTVFIRDWKALVKLMFNPELFFGDCYRSGQVEVHGDLSEILLSVNRSMQRRRCSFWHGKLFSRYLDWIQTGSLAGSRKNIHHHYDLGTEFYKLWLDPQLIYTCAYFPDSSYSLEKAQIAKMHFVCEKVQLKPGERVVEAGCGWGALAIYMAKHYGVTVRAFNISGDQIRYAREQAAQERLSDRVEFVEEDYRNIDGEYDVFVSVGMLEHVGVKHYKELGSIIDRCLTDRGRGFLHFIGRNQPSRLNSWIRRWIFPGAYPPTLREAMDVFEDYDLSILDVENLRLHYARTLACWLEKYEGSAGQVAAMFEPRFVRAWRLYLAGSAAAFRAGFLQLFQIIFARGSDNQIPWTRAHLYSTQDKERDAEWIPAMY
jgi:cyclopropane-fatty-acyl-phospholipid synthase